MASSVPARRLTQLRLKGILDRTMAVLLFIVLSPLLVTVAMAVKFCDRGPVFFRQQRLGINGGIFEIWKFRTMIVNADRYLHADGSVSVDRLTPVGRVLRFLSLDELPQLINIMRGEMSFVGPRPALTSHLARYTDEQKRRLTMKPGITGLAQVRGRNTLKWSRRIEYDLEYVEKFSLWLDLSILLRTIWVVVTRHGIVADRNPGEADDLPLPKTDSGLRRGRK